MTATNEQRELEPPADQGGVPAPPSAPEFKSRERDEDRTTRKPLDFWDRIKLVLLFIGSWLVLFWASVAQFDPAISTREAFNQTMRSYWWLIALAVLEVIRQTHYFVSEHSPRWHKAWT